MTELTRAYVAATAERHADVSWEVAERVVQLARGIPEFVSVPDTTVAAIPLIAESLGAEPEASPVDIGN
jgi:hypothetical protein